MVEEIYKNFEAKIAEELQKTESKEGIISPEKGKEILGEAVRERIAIAQPAALQQQVVAQNAKQIKAQPKERHVQLLTQMAFDKGIAEAVETAKKMDNPYLLDEFHDALVDELYKKLVEEGKLKQI
jgi:glutamate dehydrogenase/leucine dehydrogenase